MTGALSPTIFGCSGLTLTASERAFFADARPWAFILFNRNLDTPDQIKALCDDLRDAVGHDAPIFIDQEGGCVQRLRAPHWREWQPPLEFLAGRPMAHRVRGFFLRYRLIAAELKEIGIDGNCAPMLDILRPDTHEIIANRTYSRHIAEIPKLGSAVAEGLLAGGVLPVIKHIPGHGRAKADSHLELPVVDTAGPILQRDDFLPFRKLNNLPLAMTAHVKYPALDPEHCATLSKKIVHLIREDIGFKGALMTDDLSMQALDGDFAGRTATALAAGCDLILHCNGDMAEMLPIAEAAGVLEGEAARRAQRAIFARKSPQPVDIAQLQDELARLGVPA